MAKTSLQLVQSVLVNLRENSAITDFSATYSQLILAFVNRAKQKVEDSWRWRSLTTEVQLVTNLAQVQYYVDAAANAPAVSLPLGANYPDDRSYVLQDDQDRWQAFDITQVSGNNLYYLKHVSRESLVPDTYLAPARTPVQPFSFCYTLEAGRPVIYFQYPPIASRTCAFRFIVPQPEFSTGSEIILTPAYPTIAFATAFAMQERGEELGAQADMWMGIGEAELLRWQDIDDEKSYDQLLVDPPLYPPA